MKKESRQLGASLDLIAKSSVIVFLGIAVSKALTYVYRILIARSFDPEVYGLFALALMVVSIALMIAGIGLPDGLLRYLAFYRGKKRYRQISYLFRSAFAATLMTSLIIAILLYMLAETISLRIFHNSLLIPFIRFFSITIPFSVLASILLSTLLAFEKVAWNSFLNNFLQNFVKVMLLVIFIFLGLKIDAVIISYVMSAVLLFVAAYFVTRRLVPIVYRRQSLAAKEKSKVIREVLAYSWPIIFLGAIYTLFNWTDSFVIGYFMTARDVGFYNAAFTLLALFGIAPEIFKQLFFPLIVKEFSRKNMLMIRELSQQVSKWIFILNVPLFLMFFTFPGVIINVVFGKEYLAAEGVLRILAVGGLLSSLSAMLTNLLSMKGKSRLILANTIFISLLDLVMNIILVPKYGLYGAAVSTTFNLILLNVILFAEVKHYVGIVPLRRKMLRVAMVSLIPLAALFFIKHYVAVHLASLILIAVLFAAFYLGLIVLTKCLDKHDWEIIASFTSLFRKK